MFAWLAGIFGPLMSQIIGYLILGLIVTLVLVGGYFTIKHNAGQNQLLKDQKAQLEQVLKNQEAFAKATKELQEDTKKLEELLDSTVKEIIDRNEKLNTYLDSAEAIKDNRPAGPILKETIKQLRGK